MNFSKKLLFCFLFILTQEGKGQLVIGPGDTHQQEDGTSFDRRGVELSEGGVIARRNDGRQSVFSGFHRISGGIIQTQIRFISNGFLVSGGEFNEKVTTNFLLGAEVLVSGGTFRKNFTLGSQVDTLIEVTGGEFRGVTSIGVTRGGTTLVSSGIFHDQARFSNGLGELKISGGDYLANARFDLFSGTTTIEGGNFRQGLSISKLGNNGIPKLRLIGSNWRIDGNPLEFVSETTDISNLTGTLTGVLSDGNPVSYLLRLSEIITTVELVPEFSETSIAPAHIISFQTRLNRRYLLQRSENLEVWETLPDGLIGTGGMMQFAVVREQDAAHYRVVTISN